MLSLSSSYLITFEGLSLFDSGWVWPSALKDAVVNTTRPALPLEPGSSPRSSSKSMQLGAPPHFGATAPQSAVECLPKERAQAELTPRTAAAR